jgi:hypothetical protein
VGPILPRAAPGVSPGAPGAPSWRTRRGRVSFLVLYWPRVESGFPEIQARHTRASLEVLGELFPEAAPRVRARLSPLVQQAIDAAFRLDYLPVMVDLEVTHAIQDVVGPRGSRRVAREGLRRTLNGVMLRGLVRTAVALFGNTPPGLLKLAGRGYAQICRDCGELRLVSAGEREAEVRLERLPDELNLPSYLDAMAGSLEAFFDLSEVDGEVHYDPWPGGARFTLRWTPRRTGLD